MTFVMEHIIVMEGESKRSICFAIQDPSAYSPRALSVAAKACFS